LSLCLYSSPSNAVEVEFYTRSRPERTTFIGRRDRL
jgi:hypothetical protein